MFRFKEWFDESLKWDYLASEAELYPEGFRDFANRMLGRKKAAPMSLDDDDTLPTAASDRNPAVYPGVNNPRDAIAATKNKPAVYPGVNNPRDAIAATKNKPAVYPGMNNPKDAIAATKDKPAVYPGEDDSKLPMGHELNSILHVYKQVQDGITRIWKDDDVRAMFKNDPSGTNQQVVDGLVKAWNKFKGVINQNIPNKERGKPADVAFAPRQRAANRDDHWRG